MTGVAIEGEGGSAQGCAAEVTDEAPIARYASFCNGARYVLDGGQTAS